MNRKVLAVFGPVLVLAGIAGFVIPADMSLTSGAPAYNVFHLVFGAIAIALVLLKADRAIRIFNVGFGAIDLYQALASYLDLFPEQYFLWKRADDVLHVVIGAGLVAVGLFARDKPRAS